MDTPTPHGGGQPLLHQKGAETQAFGTPKQLPIGLGHDARRYGCQRLNRVLADTQILHSLYKKHHWLMRGATFYSLHLMLDKHAEAQLAVIDARDAAARLSAEGDEGSADLLVSEVIRTGEAQVWFLVEHLVDTPLARG